MSTPDRLHSLDAVRALALMLGIVLHAAMSFLPDARQIGWPFPDQSSSRTLDVTMFVIHIFRMTLFFMIAGFFARLTLHRKGWRGFVSDRAKRIGLPLVFGWCLLLPLLFVVLAWSSTQPGAQGFRIPAETPAQGLPLAHFWFLYLLLLLCAAALIARGLFVWLLDRNGALRGLIDTAVRALVHFPVTPLVIAIPLCVTLNYTEWWFMKTGIPTPERGFAPNTPAVIGYGVAFGFGWLLQRQMNLLTVLQRFSGVYLGAAIVLSIVAWLLAEPLPRFAVTATSQVFRAAYAACYTVASWCWTLGLVGAANRFCSRERDVVRYIADASYWMYLVHLPLIFALQVWMMNWPLHWSVKFPLLLAIAFAALLASYRFLVRYTFVGAVLNGRRQSAPAPSSMATYGKR